MIHLTMLLAQLDPAADPRMVQMNEQMQSTMRIVNLVQLVVFVLVVVGLWKLFTKAGEAGWKAIIPIYNTIILMKIIGRPIWWVLLLFVPCLNIIIAIIVSFDVAKCYGKGTGYGLGLAIFPMIFYPILGFSDAQYLGPISK